MGEREEGGRWDGREEDEREEDEKEGDEKEEGGKEEVLEVQCGGEGVVAFQVRPEIILSNLLLFKSAIKHTGRKFVCGIPLNITESCLLN